MIVNDINEIWSLDLAYVVEFAKYNRDVRYLLVAVDCLSRYLWVEPQKLKYAKQTTETFNKKRSKQNNQKKFGMTKTPSLNESSKKYDLIEKSSNTILTAKKNQHLPKETFDCSKVLSTNTWSLKFEWT